MSSFLSQCALGPRIYTASSDPPLTGNDANLNNRQWVYSPNILETAGSSMINIGECLRHFCTAISPILLPYLLYRYPIIDLLSTLKYAAIFYTFAFSIRTLGRFANSEYRRFVELLDTVRRSPNPSIDQKNELKLYDYECYAAPIDYKAKKKETNWYVAQDSVEGDLRVRLAEPMNTIREFLAYWAVHSFGRRMLYPGALALFKLLLNDGLVANRRKFIFTQLAQRNILLTEDGNKIDTMFWDRRKQSANGDILVICFEGNAGYYEAGVTLTPNSLNYSVLGWNMPGFGESTGNPFPINILKAAEAAMQFATRRLDFSEDQIVLYAWSIGGFPASWVSSQYPKVKGFILDASFDDLVPLAEARMPAFMKSLATFTVRRHLNLPIGKNLANYSGPITLIRRFHDEIIVTNDSGSDAERRSSNRANNLLLQLLHQRYPDLLLGEAEEEYVRDWLALDPNSRMLLYSMDEPKLPHSLSELDGEKRKLLIEQLCNKHFLDFEAGHNVPLDSLYFNIPTPVIRE